MSEKDPHLSQLKAQIKKVMIPLLIKIFELKLAAQQANAPPSRLNKKEEISQDDVRSQLNTLAEDIHLLHLWCISCQKQIEKALGDIETVEEKPSRMHHIHSKTSDNLLNKFLGKS